MIVHQIAATTSVAKYYDGGACTIVPINPTEHVRKAYLLVLRNAQGLLFSCLKLYYNTTNTSCDVYAYFYQYTSLRGRARLYCCTTEENRHTTVIYRKISFFFLLKTCCVPFSPLFLISSEPTMVDFCTNIFAEEILHIARIDRYRAVAA